MQNATVDWQAFRANGPMGFSPIPSEFLRDEGREELEEAATRLLSTSSSYLDALKRKLLASK